MIVPLGGEAGEFLVGAEIGGVRRKDSLPPRDAIGERFVYIVERLSGGFVAQIAKAEEDAAGFGGLAGLEGEESVLEGGVLIGRVEPRGFEELIARGLRLASLQQSIGEVLTDARAIRGEGDALAEMADGGVEVTRA